MIEIKNICKDYSSESGFKNTILKNISFTALDGKITSLIASTGSGKSVLLKIISGLENSTSGEIVISSKKKIIIIPSEPSSFSWLNVYDNVKYGLEKWNEGEINGLIALVGLKGYESFFPDNKSLGFRFRIALARSLAHKPEAILLDEPFNKFDVNTKQEIYSLIREVNKVRNTTILLATTNLTEALFLSDKIYLMKKDPAEIIFDFDIDLPSERDHTIYSSDKFHLLRTQIENSIKGVESQKLFNLSI